MEKYALPEVNLWWQLSKSSSGKSYLFAMGEDYFVKIPGNLIPEIQNLKHFG